MRPGGRGLLDSILRRPVAVLLAHACLVLLGFLGLLRLPRNRMPDVEYPTIVVTASLPGSTPDMMASSVAAPLEARLCEVAGLLDCTTSCVPGAATISLRFRFGIDMGEAMGEVGRAARAAAGDLPKAMTEPPTYARFNPTDTPIMYLALVSPFTPPAELEEMANRLVADPLRNLPGVARVKVQASGDFSWVVRADARELAWRGIPTDTVASALKSLGAELPAGRLSGPVADIPIQAEAPAAGGGPLMETFALPMGRADSQRQNSPVWISDIASTAAEPGRTRTGNWLDGKPCATVFLFRETGANALRLADSTRGLLDNIRKNLPRGASLEVVNDNSLPIRAGIREMEVTLALSVALVLVIIGVGLGDWRGTMIACSVVPVSLVSMFGLMWLAGFSINTLTLLALCLAIGFVVDDAVVVLENIIRHREMGKDPVSASIEGAGEVGFTMASITLSLLAVFLPVLLIPDMLGRMFREFALTLMGCISLSGLVSLLLIPVLSRWLPAASTRMTPGKARRFSGISSAYHRCLAWLVARPLTGVAGMALFVWGTLWFGGAVRKGFLPEEDRGFLILFTKSDPQAPWSTIRDSHARLWHTLAKVPEVEHHLTILGQGDFNTTPADGTLVLKLAPHPRRPVGEIAEEIRQALRRESPLSCLALNPPTIFLNTKQTKSPFQVLVTCPDPAMLPKVTDSITDWMRSNGNFTGIDSDIDQGMPSLAIHPDRARMALSGFGPTGLAAASNSAFGPVLATRLWAERSTRSIRAGLAENDSAYPETLQMLRVGRHRFPGLGESAPLQAFSYEETEIQPRQANRHNRVAAASVSFNLVPGTDSSKVLGELENRLQAVSDGGARAELVGVAREVRSSVARAVPMILFSFLVMYLTLGFLYESLAQPITVLATLPSAMLGGLMGLWLFNLEMDIYGFFGLLMLLGMVKKNAIMLIDFARQRQREGTNATEAILEASRERLRPIQLTTLAAAAGAVPMLAGWGGTSSVLKPVGAVLLGGLLVSQVVTLVLTPPLFSLMEWFSRRFRPLAGGGAP